MADINVQRRSSNAVWWIIGIVAAVILLWLLFGWGNTGTMTDPVGRGITLDQLAAMVVNTPAVWLG